MQQLSTKSRQIWESLASFSPPALLSPAGPRAGLPLEPGLQHCETRDQPEDSVQKFGRCGQSCAAGHQRHRQSSRWSYRLLNYEEAAIDQTGSHMLKCSVKNGNNISLFHLITCVYVFELDFYNVSILTMNLSAGIWSLLDSSLQSERALLRNRGDFPLQLLSWDQGLTDLPPFQTCLCCFRFVPQIWDIGVCVCVCVQMYRWTGENSYFVKGNIDSLQMGGGGYVCTACLS